jgi:hypothetical protein
LGVVLALGAGQWGQHVLDFRLVSGEGAMKYLPATVPGGFAVFDYDGDGKLDLFFANGGELPSGRKTEPEHANRLLRNSGGFKFEDVTERAGVAGTEYSFGAAVADYDNDRRYDLLVAGLKGITLYRNNGDGTFSDVTAKAGLDNKGRWSVAAAFLHIDNDADADLFVVNYVHWDPKSERTCLVSGKPDFCHPKFYEPVPNALFRNNGDGTFTDISDSSGIGAHQGKGMSAAVADFDGDGLSDIYVTNDRVFAFLFRNSGSGKFEEVAFKWNVAVPEDGRPVSGMGTDAQDINDDGRPDLLITALRDETFPLFKNTGKEMQEITALSRMSVLSRKLSGWGAAFADLDNDGWKDIAVACSDALSREGGRGDAVMEQPAWFHNTGDGKFAAGTGWEAIPRAMYRGLVTADLNDDGCPDAILTALNGEARILKNPCNTGNSWLKVDARKLGTRVRVGDQWRHVTTAAGYASSYAGPLHFGLAKQTKVTVEAISAAGRKAQIETAVNRTITLDP